MGKRATKKDVPVSSKARIFIGSSVEGLDVAYAVQENLEYEAESTVWSQGIFEPSATTLESLARELDTFDYAVFVFTPDDVIRIRGKEMGSVRDNVILELGMAIGRLGRERAVVLLPRSKNAVRLPTDLLGVTPTTFNPTRSDGNLVAALGPACNQIKRLIAKHGIRSPAHRSDVSMEPVAAGLSSELRQELDRLLLEHNSKLEETFRNFEGSLAGFVTIQHRVDQSSDPSVDLLSFVKKVLSQHAQILLKNISRHHLTEEEYKALVKTSIAGAVEELRDYGFLVPVTSRKAKDKREHVYWFPPTLSGILMAVGKSLEFSSAASRHVLVSLGDVGYLKRISPRVNGK